jgi:hypothetical protein
MITRAEHHGNRTREVPLALVVVGAHDVGVLDRLAGDLLVLGSALEASVAVVAAFDLVALGAGLAEPQGAAGEVQRGPDHGGDGHDDQEQENCDSAFHRVGATRVAAPQTRSRSSRAMRLTIA